MNARPLVLCVVVALLFSGCGTGTGARWFAPATWFSDREANAADRATDKAATERAAAIRSAHRLAQETAEALSAAPDSRPVEIATEANASALALLSQSSGPLPAGELAAIRKQIAGLLSENATVRAQAERDRQTNRDAVATLSARLQKADAAVIEAQRNLRAAFERENELANELRAQRALLWIAGAFAVLCAAGWVYVKFALGGLPSAFARGLRDLRAKNLIPPQGEPNVFDAYLNRAEQCTIARHAN